MTVKELKEELEKYPDDMEVVYGTGEDGLEELYYVGEAVVKELRRTEVLCLYEPE